MAGAPGVHRGVLQPWQDRLGAQSPYRKPGLVGAQALQMEGSAPCLSSRPSPPGPRQRGPPGRVRDGGWPYAFPLDKAPGIWCQHRVVLGVAGHACGHRAAWRRRTRSSGSIPAPTPRGLALLPVGQAGSWTGEDASILWPRILALRVAVQPPPQGFPGATRAGQRRKGSPLQRPSVVGGDPAWSGRAHPSSTKSFCHRPGPARPFPCRSLSWTRDRSWKGTQFPAGVARCICRAVQRGPPLGAALGTDSRAPTARQPGSPPTRRAAAR